MLALSKKRRSNPKQKNYNKGLEVILDQLAFKILTSKLSSSLFSSSSSPSKESGISNFFTFCVPVVYNGLTKKVRVKVDNEKLTNNNAAWFYDGFYKGIDYKLKTLFSDQDKITQIGDIPAIKGDFLGFSELALDCFIHPIGNQDYVQQHRPSEPTQDNPEYDVSAVEMELLGI